MTLLYAAVVIGVIFGGIWFAIRAVKRKLVAAAGEMSALLQEGVSATAHITATEKRRMSRAQFEYFVTYAFTARDGAEHSKEFRVSATEFDSFREGRPIDIVYLPRDPSVSATHEMVSRARYTAPGQFTGR
tara:strand:+ start:5015 stop:5407 length:393 start_codon:yes stop_codon:yes gene_type:complete